MTAELPMFPLGSVLFPGIALPLRVFEPRYRQLVADVLARGGEFGVVLIERGSEVGGGDQRFDVGTVAHIVEAAPLAGGQWAVMGLGTRRVRVKRWLPDDPYPRALVDDAPELPRRRDDDDAFVTAEDLVRRCLALRAELGEGTFAATIDLDADRARATWQLAAVAPLGPLDQLSLLRTDDPTERLWLLARLLQEQAEVLAFRAGGAEE